MKLSKLILSLLCATLVAACSSGSDKKSDTSTPDTSLDACQAFSFARTKIAQGEVCSVGSTNSPLVRLSINSLSESGVCTGAVIDSNTILTAAHCIQGNVVSIDIETTAGTFTSQNFYYPQTYDDSGEIGLNDIAIVKVNANIPITPLPLLLSADPTVGEVGYIAGFGETSPGAIDDSPRAGEVVVAGVTSRSVVVKFQGDQSHPCQGDSGGPLVVIRGGKQVIAGVVSQSDPSVSESNICKPGDITLYTSLRYPDVLSFIQSLAPNASAL